MAKRKSDFHELKFINPFEDKNFSKFVYKDWANREKLQQWRIDNSKWLKDPKMIDLLDIDELLSQWDIYPMDRRVNPKTCYMIFKELAMVLRMIDAEHQDAVLRDGNNLPGITYSKGSNKWLYVDYNLEASDHKKATKVLSYDTEEEAFYYYKQNRDSILEAEASKAIEYGLIDPSIYEKYFSDNTTICVRDYDYYKEEKYNNEHN